MTQRFNDDPQAIPGGRVIVKGIVKSYTAGTHKANVQLVGSHPTALSAVRVATDIPAADVVAGRQCTVLFLDPANQDDAVVLTIQGALPSAGGGGGAAPDIQEDGSLVKAAANPIDYKGGFDVTVDGAGVDVTLDVGEAPLLGLAQLAGRAGGQTLSGGAAASEILTLESTAHATKAYIRALDNLVVKDAAAALWNTPVVAKKATPADGWAGLVVDLGGLTSTIAAAKMVGITGKLGAADGDNVNSTHLYGLDFLAFAGRGTGSPTVTECIGCQAQWGAIATGLTVTDGACFKAVRSSSLLSVVTRAMGVWVPNIGKAIDATVYGIRVDDQTLGTTKYLMWLGDANPNLRVDAGAPPDAALATEGDTKVYAACMENGVVTVRQLRWRKQANLAAADKVAIFQ